ncbi:MAG: heparinase II/III family protein, partial [Bacteroidota bacterium]
KKAVYALLYQTDVQGQFFPINDSQKGMSIQSRELIAAVDIIYKYGGRDPELLSVVAQQGQVQLDDSGFKVAKDLAAGKVIPFKRPSIELRDGKDGTNGALGILRSEKNNYEQTVAFKYTSHGLSHGHFDKLSYSLYDSFGEVIQDYGAARWVNIDQKAGGRYLPETKTWAKQTIAHNTVTINEQSHFNGDIQISQDYHSTPYFMDISNPEFQIASAKETKAYEGVEMQRTLLLLNDPLFERPLFVDLFRVESPKPVQMDLPLWFQGHLLETSYDYDAQLDQMPTLGKSHGYQHVWKQAEGSSKASSAQLSWFSTNHFYTATTATDATDKLIIGQLGANDPNFNLRPDQCFIVRKQDVKGTLFATVLESHGAYSPVDEIPLQPYGKIKTVTVLHNDTNYSAITWQLASGESFFLAVANQDASKEKEHKLTIGTTTYSWSGPYHLLKK